MELSCNVVKLHGSSQRMHTTQIPLTKSSTDVFALRTAVNKQQTGAGFILGL